MNNEVNNHTNDENQNHDEHHTHSHGRHHDHAHGGTDDYLKAISAYRKTFPGKKDVLEQTPDPAVRDAITYGRMQSRDCI